MPMLRLLLGVLVLEIVNVAMVEGWHVPTAPDAVTYGGQQVVIVCEGCGKRWWSWATASTARWPSAASGPAQLRAYDVTTHGLLWTKPNVCDGASLVLDPTLQGGSQVGVVCQYSSETAFMALWDSRSGALSSTTSEYTTTTARAITYAFDRVQGVVCVGLDSDAYQCLSSTSNIQFDAEQIWQSADAGYGHLLTHPDKLVVYNTTTGATLPPVSSSTLFVPQMQSTPTGRYVGMRSWGADSSSHDMRFSALDLATGDIAYAVILALPGEVESYRPFQLVESSDPAVLGHVLAIQAVTTSSNPPMLWMWTLPSVPPSQPLEPRNLSALPASSNEPDGTGFSDWAVANSDYTAYVTKTWGNGEATMSLFDTVTGHRVFHGAFVWGTNEGQPALLDGVFALSNLRDYVVMAGNLAAFGKYGQTTGYVAVNATSGALLWSRLGLKMFELTFDTGSGCVVIQTEIGLDCVDHLGNA